MIILIAGATGATGKLLVEQLLERGQQVRAIVRSPEKLPDSMRTNPQLTVIKASILDLSDEEMAQQVNGCHAIASLPGPQPYLERHLRPSAQAGHGCYPPAVCCYQSQPN